MVYHVELKEMYFTHPQEFLAVKNDIKPAIRFSISENQKPQLERLKDVLEKSELNFLIKRCKEIHQLASTNIAYIVYVAKSKKLVEELSEAEKKDDRKKVGELLGYPECCVNFYFETYNLAKKDNTWCIKSFLKMKTKPHFHLNNVFNFQSRFNEKLRTLREINKTNRYTNYFLISHVPCSYDCKESIKIGRNVLKILKTDLPDFANEIVSALKHPFLVFDDLNWIAFNGVVRNKNTVKYENIVPIKSLYQNEIFRNGNKIVVQDDEIKVLMGDELIHTIKKKNEHDGVLIDFT